MELPQLHCQYHAGTRAKQYTLGQKDSVCSPRSRDQVTPLWLRRIPSGQWRVYPAFCTERTDVLTPRPAPQCTSVQCVPSSVDMYMCPTCLSWGVSHKPILSTTPTAAPQVPPQPVFSAHSEMGPRVLSDFN